MEVKKLKRLAETTVEATASKTKTLDIEKPQLTFGFIKLTDMAPLAIAKKKVSLKMKAYLFLLKHNLTGKMYWIVLLMVN